jgi:hypothetical protein
LEELITASDPDNDAAGGFLQELKADPGQPVTRVSAVLDRHIGRGTALVAVNAGQAGLLGGLLFSAKGPAYHVRWLVVSKLARRQGRPRPCDGGDAPVRVRPRRGGTGDVRGLATPGAAASGAPVLL